MNLKEWLEITATVLSIIVSVLVLYGALMAHRKGLFHALHHLALHHHQALLRKEKMDASKRKNKKS